MLEQYQERFARLHTDRNRTRWTEATTFRAPHKPLLLLSVLDLFAEGTITANLIEPGPDLLELFALYWSKVMPPDQRGNVVLPFFHLRSEGFWRLVAQPGQEEVLQSVRQVDSMPQLRQMVVGASLEEELYGHLLTPNGRESLRHTLIESYFAPARRAALYEQAHTNADAFVYSQELLGKPAPKMRESYRAEGDSSPVRSQGFRRAVMVAYDRRCAFCNIRIITSDGHLPVDASHIVPWSRTRDDRVNNGLCPCRLCHWSFDEGLISLSNEYQVIAARELMAHPNAPGYLSTLAHRSMIMPVELAHWPDIESLAWHRQEVFRRR